MSKSRWRDAACMVSRSLKSKRNTSMGSASGRQLSRHSSNRTPSYSARHLYLQCDETRGERAECTCDDPTQMIHARRPYSDDTRTTTLLR
eukprot:7279486-Pyramimonas_sp.AAC.1